MLKRLSIARAAALLLAAGTAQAAMTVYTTSAAFSAAISTLVSGTDSFDDLSSGTSYANSLARSAGAFAYTASEGPSSTGLKGAGGALDTWLQTGKRTDVLTLDGFGNDVVAAGGDFFDSNFLGRDRTHHGVVYVTATDLSGSFTIALTDPPADEFVGFVSTNRLLSVQVSMASFGRATVNDFTLAAPVPEPEITAMLLSGIALVGFVVTRRRRR